MTMSGLDSVVALKVTVDYDTLHQVIQALERKAKFCIRSGQSALSELAVLRVKAGGQVRVQINIVTQARTCCWMYVSEALISCIATAASKW